MSSRKLHESSSGGDGGDGGSGSHKPQVFLHFLHCFFLHCFAVLHFFLHFVEVSTHGGLGAAQSTHAAPKKKADSTAEGHLLGLNT